jgi:SAM-dependent methyltransferase
LTDAAVLGAIGSCDGLTVLDGGCGEGYLSRYLAMRGATAFGLDTSGALVTAAEQEGERLGLRIKYQVASLEAIPYTEKQFDIVVCNHVISDVANPEAVLTEIGRVTKPGGKLVLLMLHPCFYTAHVERGDHGDLPVEVYFSARQIDQRFNVAGIGHAIIETVFSDLIDGPLAHLPSGRFAANCAWVICAADGA